VAGSVRTVRGDRAEVRPGTVYAHEHLIIDSPFIEARYPQIHLYDTDAAIAEVSECAAHGVVLMVDAMPACSGRDVRRLIEISAKTGVDVVASTGLHHPRYYGNGHWTTRVSSEELTGLFVADLTAGIDEFDYTAPIVRRSAARAGVIKVATGGEHLTDRDRRVLVAAGAASVQTGARDGPPSAVPQGWPGWPPGCPPCWRMPAYRRATSPKSCAATRSALSPGACLVLPKKLDHWYCSSVSCLVQSARTLGQPHPLDGGQAGTRTKLPGEAPSSTRHPRPRRSRFTRRVVRQAQGQRCCVRLGPD
jgi:hypothetical protein